MIRRNPKLMLRQGLQGYLDKMEQKIKAYNMGVLGYIRMCKEDTGLIKIYQPSLFVFYGKNQKNAEEDLIHYIEEEKIKIQNKVNDLEEISLRLKEFGLERTSQYYQNLQNKNEEVGN
jgi:hypothetical protein